LCYIWEPRLVIAIEIRSHVRILERRGVLLCVGRSGEKGFCAGGKAKKLGREKETKAAEGE